MNYTENATTASVADLWTAEPTDVSDIAKEEVAGANPGMSALKHHCLTYRLWTEGIIVVVLLVIGLTGNGHYIIHN